MQPVVRSEMIPFADLDLSFVYGPRELKEPAFSFAYDEEAILHSPDAFADAVLAVPHVSLIRDKAHSWNDWLARWQVDDRSIDIDLLATDVDPACGHSVVWGGSSLTPRCTPIDLLALWLPIRDRLDGVWLHDTSCRMYSPKTFREEYVT